MDATPENWDKAVLQIIKDLGGGGTTKEIYEKIPVYIELTPHLKQFRWGNYVYQSRTRTHLTNLVRKGKLRRPRKAYYVTAEKD